jgi:hypothetical protein
MFFNNIPQNIAILNIFRVFHHSFKLLTNCEMLRRGIFLVFHLMILINPNFLFLLLFLLSIFFLAMPLRCAELPRLACKQIIQSGNNNCNNTNNNKQTKTTAIAIATRTRAATTRAATINKQTNK